MCATPASIADARGDCGGAWTRRRGRVTVAAERANVPGTRRVRGGRAREWRDTRARVSHFVSRRMRREGEHRKRFPKKRSFFI